MRKIWIMVSGVFVAVALSGCHAPGAAGATSQQAEVVSVGDVTEKVVADGTIEPFSKVDIKSKVAGRVLQLYVHEGALVHKGQVLAKIDTQSTDEQVNALRAQLAGAVAQEGSSVQNVSYQKQQTSALIAQDEQNVALAESQLQQAETLANTQPSLTKESIKIAQSNLNAAESNLKAQQSTLDLMVQTTDPNNVVSTNAVFLQDKAQAANNLVNLNRDKALLKSGFVSEQQVDAARTTYVVSESQLADAKQKLDNIKQANAIQEASQRSLVAAAQAQVEQAAASLVQAKEDTSPITRQDAVIQARASLAQAKAQLLSARSNLVQNVMRKYDATAAAANVQQIQNQLNLQLVQKYDSVLYAPMTGIITKRYVEVGDLIESAISSFSSGNPVYQLADLNTMLVKILVNEVDIDRIKSGMLTRVTVDAVPGVVFYGKVDKVAPAASNYTSSSSSSSTSDSTKEVIRFPVEIRIDHADPRLRPGMSAQCTVIVAAKQKVLRIPADCVSGTSDHASVRVLVGSETAKPLDIQTRQVLLGVRSANYIEVISGLKPGDRVLPTAYTGPKIQGFNVRAG